jgi:hypothetical protein
VRTFVLFAILAGLSSAVLAEGPGSRIRATPSGPQSPGASNNDAKRCAGLREEAKDRCIKQAREAAAAERRTRK